MIEKLAIEQAELSDEQLVVLRRRFGLVEKLPSDCLPKPPDDEDDGGGSSGSFQHVAERV